MSIGQFTAVAKFCGLLSVLCDYSLSFLLRIIEVFDIIKDFPSLFILSFIHAENLTLVLKQAIGNHSFRSKVTKNCQLRKF